MEPASTPPECSSGASGCLHGAAEGADTIRDRPPFASVCQWVEFGGVFCPVVALDHPRLMRCDLNFFWVGLCLMQTRFLAVLHLEPQKKDTIHPAEVGLVSKWVELRVLTFFCSALFFLLTLCLLFLFVSVCVCFTLFDCFLRVKTGS